MGYLFKPTELVKDSNGKPVIGADGEPQRKPKTKFWYIRYYDVNGEQQEESTKQTSKEKATAVLTLREASKINGELPATRNKFTFVQGTELIINDYIVNRLDSIGDLKGRIKNHLIPAFGSFNLDRITSGDITDFTNARVKAGASNATVNRDLSIIRRILTLAVQQGKIKARPHVEMLAEKNARKGFFERDEFDALREALPEYLQNLFTVAYFTGWRVRAELMTLELSNVDAHACTLRLDAEQAKNDEGRTFFYTGLTELKKAIDEQMARGKAFGKKNNCIVKHLFFDNDGREIRVTNYYEDFRAALKVAGIAKLPHDMRRTAVRNLVRAGISEKVAQKMTGHKTRSVFDRYDIVDGRDMQEAALKLQAFSQDVKKKTGSPKVRRIRRAS